MSAALTYHVRAGQLSAVVLGRVFHLPTHSDSTRVQSWEKAQEVRSGKYTLWDHCFEPVHQHSPSRQSVTHAVSATTVIQRLGLRATSPGVVRGIYDWPGEYAQRFDGAVPHHHRGSAIYVGDRQAGVYIHGWPACTLKPCIVVLRQWDDLARAVASQAELSFAIVV